MWDTSWWLFIASMLHEKPDPSQETQNQISLILSFLTTFYVCEVNEMICRCYKGVNEVFLG
jgi:hypothetical protein